AFSKLIFVVFNMSFLHFKLGIVPLLRNHAIIPLTGALSYGIVLFLPLPGMHWIVELVMNSILITIFYGILLRTFRVVPKVKQFFRSF
ncbi:MAG: hypothetical protein ACQEQ0_10385, partial [Bacteroidota bacterium]